MKRTASRARIALSVAALVAVTSVLAAAPAAASNDVNHPGEAHRNAAQSAHRPRSNTNLSYQGGIGGVGVATSPAVYIVYWGSQWTGNDPVGEAAIQQAFFNGVGGSAWAASVTQYCQNVSAGTQNCFSASGAVFAGNPTAVLKGVWSDTGAAAPAHPTQSQVAAEAVRAAAHFNNTSSTVNTNAQYIVSTATGNSSSGFGTQWCAYHSSTSSSYGNVAYTNFPYISDAGGSCGAGSVNSGSRTDGITIVGGHEYAETVTDMFPNGGWLDSAVAENGDKCAWISAPTPGYTRNVSFSTGTFPVQSLWSNSLNNFAGGCVIGYSSPTSQQQ